MEPALEERLEGGILDTPKKCIMFRAFAPLARLLVAYNIQCYYSAAVNETLFPNALTCFTCPAWLGLRRASYSTHLLPRKIAVDKVAQ